MPLVRTATPNARSPTRSDTTESMMYEEVIVGGIYQDFKHFEMQSSTTCLSTESQTSCSAGELCVDDIPPYTTLPEGKKILTLVIASLAAFLSPVSANIYYPALNPLAQDLHVSKSMINLTITSFMVGGPRRNLDALNCC